MTLTLLRQALLPVLLAWLLVGTKRLELVWLAFGLAEIICIPLAERMWRGRLRHILNSFGKR